MFNVFMLGCKDFLCNHKGDFVTDEGEMMDSLRGTFMAVTYAFIFLPVKYVCARDTAEG